MDFFLLNDHLHFKSKVIKPTPVRWEEQIYNAYVVRAQLHTFVFMFNANERWLHILFGTKRIRLIYEANLRYKILSLASPLKNADTGQIEIDNDFINQNCYSVKPFIVSVKY